MPLYGRSKLLGNRQVTCSDGHLVFTVRVRNLWQSELEFPLSLIWRYAWDTMTEAREIIRVCTWESRVELADMTISFYRGFCYIRAWFYAPTITYADLVAKMQLIEPWKVSSRNAERYARYYLESFPTDVSRRHRRSQQPRLPSLGNTQDRWHPMPDLARAWNEARTKYRTLAVTEEDPERIYLRESLRASGFLRWRAARVNSTNLFLRPNQRNNVRIRKT